MIAHKLAKYFPVLEGEEFDLLVQDIKEHGQLEPIVLCDGEILDGMNRYNACLKLGIDSIVEEYKGDDPLSYVISLNIRRRHLDTSQRAMLALEMLPEFERETKVGRPSSEEILRSKDLNIEKGQASDRVAKEFGISGPSVRRAKRIKEEAPERVDKIIKGEETVGAVDAEIRQAKATERAAEKTEKADTKEVKQHPKCVKEYLDSSQIYNEALKLAIKCAKKNMFAQEAMQFIRNRHNQTKMLMEELEKIE